MIVSRPKNFPEIAKEFRIPPRARKNSPEGVISYKYPISGRSDGLESILSNARGNYNTSKRTLTGHSMQSQRERLRKSILCRFCFDSLRVEKVYHSGRGEIRRRSDSFEKCPILGHSDGLKSILGFGHREGCAAVQIHFEKRERDEHMEINDLIHGAGMSVGIHTLDIRTGDCIQGRGGVRQKGYIGGLCKVCLLYTSPSPRD